MTLTEEDLLRLNKELKPFLHEIQNKIIKLDEDEESRNIKVLEEFRTRLADAMKEEDDLFRELYRRPTHTGSSYEKLRVHSADEFDLNLVLRLPFNQDDVEISRGPSDSAYVQCRVIRDPHEALKLHQKYKAPFLDMFKRGFFDSDNFLQQDKLRQWIQSILTKAMNRFKLPEGILSYTLKQSGPAWTYQLETEWGKIDVDFVTVINISRYNPLKGMNPGVRFGKLGLKSEFETNWFLVPKPFKVKSEDNVHNRYWRMSFPEAEKALLRDTGCLTMLIKFFKMLRDRTEYWRKRLPSYFIKTFFLWQYEAKDSDEWHPKNLGRLFMEMLENFQEAISKRTIPYYFNKDANLLEAMTDDDVRIIEGRIKHIVNKIRLNPRFVLELYELEKPKVAATTGINEPFTFVERLGIPEEDKKKEESGWRCVIL